MPEEAAEVPERLVLPPLLEPVDLLTRAAAGPLLHGAVVDAEGDGVRVEVEVRVPRAVAQAGDVLCTRVDLVREAELPGEGVVRGVVLGVGGRGGRDDADDLEPGPLVPARSLEASQDVGRRLRPGPDLVQVLEVVGVEADRARRRFQPGDRAPGEPAGERVGGEALLRV